VSIITCVLGPFLTTCGTIDSFRLQVALFSSSSWGLFESEHFFKGGVGRAIREDGVLLKLDFFKTKFDQNEHHFYTLLSVSIVVSVSVHVV